MTADVLVRINGTPVDPCLIARPLEITHGRSTTAAQPDAPVCGFTWTDPAFPWQLGALVEVVVTPGLGAWDDPGGTWADAGMAWDGAATAAGSLLRFAGGLAEVTASERDGQLVAWEVRAVGRLADLGRVRVTLDRPAETDVDRITAIAAAAGVTGAALGNPGITLAAATIDTDALSALHDVCRTSGGLIWQDRAGAYWYGTADHRSLSPLLGPLPACSILDGVQWTQDVESIVNHVTATWGPDDARAQVTHTDPGSMAAYGMRHVDVDTQCATEADADQLALLIIARRKQPYWVMPGVMIPMDELTRSDLDVLQRLVDVSSAGLVPITPTPQPTPGALSGWVVEGWVERWDESGRWLQLALSDRARWVETTLRTWATAATVTWADEAGGSWLDALIEEAAA